MRKGGFGSLAMFLGLIVVRRNSKLVGVATALVVLLPEAEATLSRAWAHMRLRGKRGARMAVARALRCWGCVCVVPAGWITACDVNGDVADWSCLALP